MSDTLLIQIRNFFATQPVVKAWLFGSYVRNEQTPDSDIDLLVRFDEEQGVSLLGHIRIMYELQDLLGIRVDLVTEGTLLPSVAEQADKEKVLIYERATA